MTKFLRREYAPGFNHAIQDEVSVMARWFMFLDYFSYPNFNAILVCHNSVIFRTGPASPVPSRLFLMAFPSRHGIEGSITFLPISKMVFSFGKILFVGLFEEFYHKM